MNYKFLQLYNKILLENKQEFSLLDNKEKIIKILNDALLDLKKHGDGDDTIDLFIYDLSRPIYYSLRYKSKFNKINKEFIDENILKNFNKEITKNLQSSQNIDSSWISFTYFIDEDFTGIGKTYSKYITPNINYNQNDLLILQNALVNLQNITKEMSKQYNINLALKYNVQFEQYFTQNDNIKLYCFNKEHLPMLDKIEQEFLNLFPNKDNNRIYNVGIDFRLSFGQRLAKNIAQEILIFLIKNKYSPEEAFNYLNINFEQLIKKYSKSIIQND